MLRNAQMSTWAVQKHGGCGLCIRTIVPALPSGTTTWILVFYSSRDTQNNASCVVRLVSLHERMVVFYGILGFYVIWSLSLSLWRLRSSTACSLVVYRSFEEICCPSNYSRYVMNAAGFFFLGTSVHFMQAARCHIPVDSSLTVSGYAKRVV